MDQKVETVRRGTRASLVRKGLDKGMTNTEIADWIETVIPGQNRKNVLTLCSRYRSYLRGSIPINGQVQT